MRVRLLKTSLTATTGSNTIPGKNYTYYDIASDRLDTPYKFQELLNSATSSIKIMDPHIQSGDEKLFENICHDNIEISVLTILSKDQNDNDMNIICEDIFSLVNSKASNIKVNISYYYRRRPNFHYNNINHLWHDRFLIIDDDKVFLIGSSLSNHITGNQSYGIYELKDDEDKKIVKQTFYNYYKNVNQPNNGHKVSKK